MQSKFFLRSNKFFNPQWRQEATLCDNKNHRKHRKTDNGILILAVGHVSDDSLPISKKMTTLLRHSLLLREPDGALHWHIIMDQFKGFDNNVGWSFRGLEEMNTDRTTSGSSIASSTWAIRSTYELFKDAPV